jgi:hypothetical protein
MLFSQKMDIKEIIISELSAGSMDSSRSSRESKIAKRYQQARILQGIARITGG